MVLFPTHTNSIPPIDVAETVHKMEIFRKNQNRMVINLPPDKSGRLILSDQENLF